jgi:hypothetical protein
MAEEPKLHILWGVQKKKKKTATHATEISQIESLVKFIRLVINHSSITISLFIRILI